jgi:hypothetical protein
MALSVEEAIRIVSRLRVLEHVVGALVRDLALQAGQTADDMAQTAEEAKAFFESKAPHDEAIYLTAAVDRLYQQIAADMRPSGTPRT